MQQQNNIRIGWVAALLVVAVAGFADAAYLTIEHYRGVIPPCSVVSGCETVLTSAYSSLSGVPVALAGAAYYLLMAVAAFMYIESKHSTGTVGATQATALRWALRATPIGLVASAAFVYIQLGVLHSICLYCMGSALTSTVLFVLACMIWRKRASLESHE